MAEKKILIIDADVASRNFIARTLSEQNYQVVQSGSGKEGLICVWRDRPDLLIMDPKLADMKGEEVAARLRQDGRTAKLPLIALSSDPSVTRIKACLDAGFNEYITKSGQAIPLLNDAVGRLMGITQSAAKQGGLLIVFLSAKGGVGVSSLCANMAMNIATNQPEMRVAVVDLVLPIGSIAPIVGYTGTQNIVTVAGMNPAEVSPDFIQQQLAEMELWRFHLLSGCPDPESSNHLNVGHIWDIITLLKTSYDFVLIDLGRSLSRISLPLIQNADLAVLVVSTDFSTVELTKTLLEYLNNKGVRNNSIYPILNRAVGLEGLSKAEAEKMLGVQIKTTMPYLGSNFALANNQHQPFSLKFPMDTAAVIFKETAREMIVLAKKIRME